MLQIKVFYFFLKSNYSIVIIFLWQKLVLTLVLKEQFSAFCIFRAKQYFMLFKNILMTILSFFQKPYFK